VIALAPVAVAKKAGYDLPPGALVVEECPLPRQAHVDRALVLWMLRPEKHPREHPSEDYVCPEYTRGSYYSGPTRVSLVDTRGRRIINTLDIVHDKNRDTYDIPYRIRPTFFYAVPQLDPDGEGTPRILHLKDYNGDGKALEFALFDGDCCMCLETALIGYSPTRDRLLWYPIDLAEGHVPTKRRVSRWGDHLFAVRPKRPGYWNYEIDYSGRGGSRLRYDVRYDRGKGRFEGTVVAEDEKEDDGEKP
jgi:hypothetical protein